MIHNCGRCPTTTSAIVAFCHDARTLNTDSRFIVQLWSPHRSSVISSLVERWYGRRQGGGVRVALWGRHQRGDIRQDGSGAPSGCHWAASESPRRLSCITMRQLSDCAALMGQQVSAKQSVEKLRGGQKKENRVCMMCARLMCFTAFDGKVVFGLAAPRRKYNERAGGHALRGCNGCVSSHK